MDNTTSKAMSRAEENATSVSYEVQGNKVDLDLDFVKRYLVRGKPDTITDQEIVFFMNTCKAQGLNPLVNGEVFLIKFGSEPAQMVVGKGAYMRRAFEHPDYLGKDDGITVQRGQNILQKEGTCPYPGETLIGGWCRVRYMRGGKERTAFKEVALEEYNKGQANWKTKPSTMINKVAVSQCLREAFPKDYEGIFSEEEMIASGAIPATESDTLEGYVSVDANGEVLEKVEEEDGPVPKDKLHAMFKKANEWLGDDANDQLRQIIKKYGCESTKDLRMSTYKKVLQDMVRISFERRGPSQEAAPEQVEPTPAE